jgi:hypothetical protein
MSSNINPFNIDGTYPVAGQDNDSQGFRDNFTNIRNNLSFAKTELEDLQSKVLLKSALTGTTLDNNMGGAPVVGAQLRATSATVSDHSTLTGSLTLDFNTGNVHKVATSGDITLSFSNWPISGLFGSLRLWVYITDPAHRLVATQSNGVTLGITEIAGLNATNGYITFDLPGNYVFEFSTIDNGSNILIRDLTRNYASLRDTNLYYDDQNTSTLFVNFGTSLNGAIALDGGQDAISTYGSMNSVSVGNLSVANVAYTNIDNGGLAGYSVTSARGNLQTATVTPVKSNDYLGYVNAIAFTGNGAGNVFQQTSSLEFFATGSNVSYGLGGNVGVFTTRDGARASGGFKNMYQNVGFENDHSTKFFGNVVLNTTIPAPVLATNTGTPGQIAYDSNYIYICIGTNSWKRVSIAAW